MMKSTGLLIAVLAVGACASNDGPPRQKGQISQAGASEAVANLAGLRASMHAGDGNAVADAVLALTSGGQALVTPAAPAGASAITVPPQGMLPRFGKLRTESVTGEVACDDSGCTFDHVSETDGTSSFTLDGSIHVAGDTVTVDLTMNVAANDGASAFDMTWSLDGALTVSAVEIDGNFHAHGDASFSGSGQSGSITWDEAIDYNHIGLDGSGCPISGSLSADIAYTASTPQGGGSFALEASIGFGPTCGAYTSL